MRKCITPCYYVPTIRKFFDFHMQEIFKEKCPGKKRLDRLFSLYKMTCDDKIEWTEYGYDSVRSCIEAYKDASEKVITADFLLLRKAYLVFVCGETVSPVMKLFGELMSDCGKVDVDFSEVLNGFEKAEGTSATQKKGKRK